MRTFDLAAVGDVMLDVETELRPPRHGPVAVRAGGSTVNAAIAAAEAGASVLLVGRVGADDAGAAIRARLERAGVTAALSVDGARPTGTCLYLPDGVVADRGANAALTPEDVPRPLRARSVLVSGYLLLHENTAPAARKAIDAAEADWIALDVASPRLVRDSTLELCRGANAVFANETEAAPLGGLDVLAERFRLVCVKRGANAPTILLDGAPLAPPELPPESVGDGDVLAARVLVSLTHQRARR